MSNDEIPEQITEPNIEGEEQTPAADPEFEKQLVAELEAREALAAEEAAALAENDADAAARGKKAVSDLSDEQKSYIMGAMEALIFMSDRPMSLPKLRSVIDDRVPLAAYRELMAQLRAEFARDHRGVEIAELSLGFQLRTKPHMTQVLRKLVKTTPLKLTPAMMEVLAVVAYKQPVTKDDLDQIRGVDCSYLLRSLMEKRLIRISGRSELPGRPMLYSTTHEFLELFSLKDIAALPPLHEIENMVAASEVGREEKEKEELENFGKMVEASHGQVLFDDSKLDHELEEIRSVIDSIPTSTDFIDEQKTMERLNLKISALKARGLTLDVDGKEVALDSPEGQAGEAARAEAAENLRRRMLEAAGNRRAEETADISGEVADIALEVVENAEPTALEAAPTIEMMGEEPRSEIIEEAAEDTRELSEEILAAGDALEAEKEGEKEAETAIDTAATESDAGLAFADVTGEEPEDEQHHRPSDELVAAAEAAQTERHAEMLESAQRIAEETAPEQVENVHDAIEFEGLEPLKDDETTH